MNRRNHQEKVLTHLYASLLYGPYMSHPGMSLIKWFLKDIAKSKDKDLKNLTEDQVRMSLYRLEKKQFIRKVRGRNNKTKIELTRRGKEHAHMYNIESISIQPAKKWDERWRFVMFDISEKSKYMRDIFRDKLTRLGFFRAQKSVWVYPYDCEEEINSLAEFLNVQDSVLIFTADMKQDKMLRKHFSERGIIS